MNSPKQNALFPWLWYGIAAVVVLFDQWTKILSDNNLVYNQPEVMTSFFNLTLRYNYGVAFSMFDNIAGQQRWPLAALAFIVSIAIFIWIWRTGKKASLEAAGLGFILGGALGNLYDRVAYGYVIDFIEVHAAGYHWPAFNIADSAICLGAGLLLYDGFFGSGRKAASD